MRMVDKLLFGVRFHYQFHARACKHSASDRTRGAGSGYSLDSRRGSERAVIPDFERRLVTILTAEEQLFSKLQRMGSFVHRSFTGRTPVPAPRRRSTDHEPHRGWKPILLIAAGVALLDWLTKAVIVATIPLNGILVVVDDRFALWHVKNPAMILGLFGDLPLRYRQILAALLAIAGVTLLLQVVTRAQRLLPHRRPWAWAFVGLVLGGMLGNVGERAFFWGITDFISFGWAGIWLPPGNIADLAIFLSIPIALLVIVFEVEARSRRSRQPADLRLAPDATDTQP